MTQIPVWVGLSALGNPGAWPIDTPFDVIHILPYNGIECFVERIPHVVPFLLNTTEQVVGQESTLPGVVAEMCPYRRFA